MKNKGQKRNEQQLTKLKTDAADIHQLIETSRKSSDFRTQILDLSHQKIYISYFNTLIEEKKIQKGVFLPLQEKSSSLETEIKDIREISSWLPVEEVMYSEQIDVIQGKLLKGCILIQLDMNDQKCLIVLLSSKLGLRQNNNTENEFSVVGPKVGFIEDLDTNIHLLRVKINIPNLVVKEISVGSVSKSRVAIIYIEGITNSEIVDRFEQRLQGIDFEIVFDTSQMSQVIADNSASPFPLFLSTERRDRVVYALSNGQAAFIIDGSPYFVTGPSTLFDFFISPEDYYLPWMLGSFFRLIRIFGVIFSLFSGAMYVAIITFQYEVVPHNLLGPLIFSRLSVPFPPILEVLFLEMTIEFLREAGARLPAKIGQTLGIVGGIILGQAAVEAALTSNILIIIVSLSALASFTTPIYKMANLIRFLRFPFIILASIWGGLGIFIGVCFLLVHLIRLESLGYPYLVPIYPLRVKDFRDSFIRTSYRYLNNRPRFLRPYSMLRNVVKTDKHQKDWDEE